MSYLSRGVHGEPVRILQDKLGITADGVFGVATEEALKAYQSSSGLAADGIAGPDTFMSMQLHELLLLQKGTHGDAVRKLQQGLGVEADGKFGPGTDAAVRKFQQEKGLDVDGIAGPRTLAQVAGFEDVTIEKVEASEIKENTVPVDPAAVAAAQNEPPPPQGIVAKVEDKIADVGKSIWNTVKKIF